jgi:hypothetical protein
MASRALPPLKGASESSYQLPLKLTEELSCSVRVVVVVFVAAAAELEVVPVGVDPPPLAAGVVAPLVFAVPPLELVDPPVLVVVAGELAELFAPLDNSTMNVSMRVEQPNEVSDPSVPSHELENSAQLPSLEIWANDCA